MRRGIGVAHVQQKKETQKHMADLGAQISAERVGQVADQLEALERQLRALAIKHKNEIKHDPVVRGRFRQLADSLGVDLISSKKNVFAGLLGLGDFYYGLASKVVELCMKERKFCGSFVPLDRLVQMLQRQYDATNSGKSKRVVINDSDVRMALDKLHVLGEGYNVVKLGGKIYIQTTPDGTRAVDDVPLLESVLAIREERIASLCTERHKNARQVAARNLSTQSGGVGVSGVGVGSAGGGGALLNRFSVGATVSPVVERSEGSAPDEPIPLSVQYVALTRAELEGRLMWPPHRVQAVLDRLVQEGMVWIDYAKATGTAAAAAVENVMDARGRKTQTTAAVPVYWFLSLASD